MQTPALTLVINTKSLAVNRNIINIYDQISEAIVGQFFLHYILNLDYLNDKPHYYQYLEVISGLMSVEECTKINKTLFLVYAHDPLKISWCNFRTLH